MIPTVNEDLTSDFEIQEIPGKTFKLIEKNGELVFTEILNEIESLKQAIFFALNVERYKNIIFDWTYGMELDDLYGQEPEYVISTLKSRIEDTLVMDDRIESVSDFSYKQVKNKITFNFTVNSIYGEIKDIKSEVTI